MMTREEREIRPVVCPICGDVFETRDKIARIVQNMGYCPNLTCLTDLSSYPLDQAAPRPGRRRETDVAPARS